MPGVGSPTRSISRTSSIAGVTGVNQRVHRTIRAVPAERLVEERARMRPLPEHLPDTDRRSVVRVPQQPYLRVDRNEDYLVDLRFAGGGSSCTFSMSM